MWLMGRRAAKDIEERRWLCRKLGWSQRSSTLNKVLIRGGKGGVLDRGGKERVLDIVGTWREA